MTAGHQIVDVFVLPFACLSAAGLACLSTPFTLWHVGRNLAHSPMQANLSFLQAEERTASNCSKAWASLRTFESYFSTVQVDAKVDQQYMSSRPQCLDLAKQLADDLGLSAGLALDAVLMLDRLVHHRADLFTQVRAYFSVNGDLPSRPVKLVLWCSSFLTFTA